MSAGDEVSPEAPRRGPLSDPSARRGRTPRRTQREIVEAAIALADRDGLPAVTMRAVARSLGTGAASLYRYVSTRDELLELMVDEVNAEFSRNAPDERHWVDQMLDIAHEVRGIYRRHPWLVEAMEPMPTLGPNGWAYLEMSLAVLALTPADGGTKLEAVGVFNALVRSLCTQERDLRRAGESGLAPQSARGDELAAVASPDGPYPHVAAALADAGPPGDQFDRILRRVLNGLLGSDD